jgi:hypothetical protein
MEKQRVRKVSIEKLNEEQLQAVEQKLVEKINPIVQKAIQDANRFLEPYGLSAKMAFEVVEKQ